MGRDRGCLTGLPRSPKVEEFSFQEKEGEGEKRKEKKTGRIIITSQKKSWKTTRFTARFKVGALTAETAMQKERKEFWVLKK